MLGEMLGTLFSQGMRRRRGHGCWAVLRGGTEHGQVLQVKEGEASKVYNGRYKWLQFEPKNTQKPFHSFIHAITRVQIQQWATVRFRFEPNRMNRETTASRFKRFVPVQVSGFCKRGSASVRLVWGFTGSVQAFINLMVLIQTV